MERSEYPHPARFPRPRVRDIVLAAALMTLAAAAARASGDDLAGRAAARIRSGEPEVVRQLGTDLLIGLGDEALPAVGELASSTDPIARAAALEILGSRPREAERFLPFLDDPSYYVRKAALEGLQNAGDGRPLRERILPLLDDPFWPVRRAAVRAAAAWPGPECARHLFKALKDPEPLVRSAALHLLDELREDIPGAMMREASAGLSLREDLAFLESCLPLVRRGNLAYFEERAREDAGTAAGTIALCVAVSLTRTVPEDRLPDLIEQVLWSEREEVRDHAALILLAAGEKAVPPLRAMLLDSLDEAASPPGVTVNLLLSILGREAVPILASWTLDTSFPMAVREACLDHLTARDWEEGAGALVRLFPDLDGALQRRAVQKANGLARSPAGPSVAPLLLAALERMDEASRRRAFEGLCLLPDPPMDALAGAFKKEEDPDQRMAFAQYLVNAAEGGNRLRVASLLYGEIEHGGPAAGAAAAQLYQVADEAMAREAVEPIRMLMEGEPDSRSREELLIALIHLDNAEADRVVAGAMEDSLEGNDELNLVLLVRKLSDGGGAATADLLCGIYQEAGRDEELKKEILRTLVNRSDPRAVPLFEEVFALESARITYRRSILEALAASGLSGACGGFLSRIVMLEKDPDLLAPAVEATPLTVLRGLETRLIELAGLAPELGMDTVEAVYDALARAARPTGIAFLRGKVNGIVENAPSSPADFAGGGAADLALMAALSLARAGNGEAPALIAELLFLQAVTFRGRDILALWQVESTGGLEGKDHNWPRALLRGLLAFDDRAVEGAVFPVIAAWRKDGRIYQCGDAVFGTLCRELAHANRCPSLAAAFAGLTLSCAPAYSPSDFRIHLLQSGLHERRGDHERAAKSLAAACHILKFYEPAEPVIRDELGFADAFEGYFPAAALASDLHRLRAIVLEAAGDSAAAQDEMEQARRRSPFIR